MYDQLYTKKRKVNITERRRRNGDWMALNSDWMVTEMYLPFSPLNGDWMVTEWRLSVFMEWSALGWVTATRYIIGAVGFWGLVAETQDETPPFHENWNSATIQSTEGEIWSCAVKRI